MSRLTADQADALTALRRYLAPGSTLYTIVKHVSRSGLQRSIAAYAIRDGEPQWLSGYIASAGIARRDNARDANVVHGCGMDMCFWLTYEVSRALWPEGFGCIGKPDDVSYATHTTRAIQAQACPSNDHSNGDRDYTPHVGPTHSGVPGDGHWHLDGGYALRSRSL